MRKKTQIEFLLKLVMRLERLNKFGYILSIKSYGVTFLQTLQSSKSNKEQLAASFNAHIVTVEIFWQLIRFLRHCLLQFMFSRFGEHQGLFRAALQLCILKVDLLDELEVI